MPPYADADEAKVSHEGKSSLPLPAVAAAIYFALALLLAFPFLFMEQTLYLSDITFNNEPVIRFMHDSWQATGRFPHWNPYVLCGAPQVQLLWPVAYIPGLVFLFLPWGQAAGLLCLFHFFIAGMGGFLWRRYAIDSPSCESRFVEALFFGLCFMLCGYMASGVVNPGLASSAAWIPFVLYLLERVLVRPRLWLAAILAFVFGNQIASGRPEIVSISSLLYGTHAAALVFQCPKGERALYVKGLLALAFAFLLAVMLATIDLIPLMDLVKQSPAVGSLGTLSMSYWSMGWFDLAGVVLSQPFGHLSMSKYAMYPSYPGDMPYIPSLFLGAPVVTLCLFGFLDRTWSRRWFWLVWACSALVVSLGEFGPLKGLFAYMSPDWQVMRFPIKVSLFFLFAVSVAAGRGLTLALAGQAARQGRLITLFWSAVGIAGLVLMFLPLEQLKAVLGLSHIANDIAGDMKRLPLEIIACAATGILPAQVACLEDLKRGSTRVPAMLVICVAGGLLSSNAVVNAWRTVDTSFFMERSELVRWLRDHAGRPLSMVRVLCLLEDPLIAPPAVTSLPRDEMDSAYMQYARTIFKPNTSMDVGVRLSNGMSTIPSWTQFFLSTGLLPRSSLKEAVLHPAGKSDVPLARFCQATATRFVLTAIDEVAGQATRPVPRLASPYFVLREERRDLNLRIYEVRAPRARVALISRCRVFPDRYQALTYINRADTNGYSPLSEVLITDSTGRLGKADFAKSEGDPRLATMFSQAVVREETSDTLVIKAQTREPAMLVIADSFYQGWQATDNGQPTDVFLADGLLRAVRLAPGEHEITFTFKPQCLFWAELLSKMTLALIGLLAATVLFKPLR